MKQRRFKNYMFLLFIIIALVWCVGCSKMYEKKYYEDINNFITDEAIVDNIIYNEEENYIVLWLLEIDESYQCNDFIIEGNNTDLVIKNGIFDKIKMGDTITFTSAPRIFGNGDFLPVVEILIGEATILSFEEGYENLMKLY